MTEKQKQILYILIHFDELFEQEEKPYKNVFDEESER